MLCFESSNEISPCYCRATVAPHNTKFYTLLVGDKKNGANHDLLIIYITQVFIGETLSARVSHLHIRPNTTQKITKTKSSGLCVSTGTGSTSWHTSINRLSTKNVEDLLKILKCQSKVDLNGLNAEQISDIYNHQLVFEPGKMTFINKEKNSNFN